MRLGGVAILFLVAWAAGAAAQQAKPAYTPPPAPCKDHTVDEYLAEMHKKQRNKNPLPSNLCILGWCPQPHAAPGNDPVSHPPQAPPVATTKPPETSSGESSSRATNPDAGDELRGSSRYNPIAGARNVEAGDYYFGRENYRAALSRYQEALEDKPDDPAIHLRLGRAYEKLDDAAKAYEHYDAALILSPEGPGAKPAREGLERLRPQLEKAGTDPKAIHQRNAAVVAASCPAGKP